METMTLNCRSCGAAIEYKDGARNVGCDYCGTVTIVKESGDVQSRIADINSQSAAATYINISLDKTDWNEFALDPSAASIEELDLLIEKIIRTAGDKPETYVMSFNYLHVCLTKKLEALKAAVEELVKEYIHKKNFHAAENKFDAISQSSGMIAGVATGSVEKMELYCKLAEQNGADAEMLSNMRQKQNMLEELLMVKIPASFDDIPEIKDELAREREEQAKIYSEIGIDAEKVYTTAVNAFVKGYHDAALSAFSSIEDFADSKKYIQKINFCATVLYDDGAFDIVGKNVLQYDLNGDSFKLKTSDGLLSSAPYAKVHGIKDNKYGEYFNGYKKFWGSTLLITSSSDSLKFIDLEDYKISYKGGVQGFLKPKELELTENILFYNNISVFPYRETDNIECGKILVAVKTPDRTDKERVRLRKEFFRKNSENILPEEVTMLNDCCDLWELDLQTKRLALLLQNIDSYFTVLDHQIFFLTPLVDSSVSVRRKERPAYTYSYCSYNKKDGSIISGIMTGKFRLEKMLDDGGLIFRKYGDKSIDNFDLIYKKSINSRDIPTTIEKNVYECGGIYGNKVLYGIGNADVKALYCYDINTQEVVEINKYYNKVAFVLENWVYFKVGRQDFFSMLRKPLDGGNWEVVIPVTTQLVNIDDSSIRKTDMFNFVRNGRVYFKSKNNELCSVRLNGTGFSNMVRGINEILSINKTQVFYTAADDNKQDSLYSMNHNGSMRRKHELGVFDSATFFGEKIYFTQKGKRTYTQLFAKLTTPKALKLVDKALKKYRAANIDMEREFTLLREFDCNTLKTSDITQDYFYPTKSQLNLIKKGFNQAKKEYKKSRLSE